MYSSQDHFNPREGSLWIARSEYELHGSHKGVGFANATVATMALVCGRCCRFWPTPRLPFSVHMVRSRGFERRLARRTEPADYFFKTIPSNGAPSGVAGLKQVKFSVEPLREDSFEYCNRASASTIDAIKLKAKRLCILSMMSTTAAGSGHPTSCMSAAEVLARRRTCR